MAEDSEMTPPRELFAALEREPSLSSRVARRMEEMIVTNQLQPGDRFPTERELGRQFGVSRTVVREALSALIAKSLLEAVPGGGTRIRIPTAESVAQSMTLFLRGGQAEMDYTKVHEVRRVLEVEIAGLAAERRTADDLEKLEANVLEKSRLYGDWDRYIKNDVEFHSLLAQATHNELFSLLLDSVVDIMVTVRAMGLRVPGCYDRALAHHQAIFAQVKQGDPAEARRAMMAHLIDSEDIMRAALAQHKAQKSDA